MPYTTKDAVRAIVARTVPSTGTAASLTDTQVDAAIESAQSVIDSKLGMSYEVPFPDGTVPRLVVRIANDLAAFDIDQTFREVRDYASELNPIYLRYKEAMTLLDQLQKGTATLPDYEPPDGEDTGDPSGGNVVAVFNPNLCAVDLSTRRCRSWEQDYYYGP